MGLGDTVRSWYDNRKLREMVIIMHILKLFITIWGVLSVLISVTTNEMFSRWLVKRGLPVRFLLSGTPGYLDGLYTKWCREHGQSPNRILMLRKIQLINMIIVAIAFIGLCIPNR